MAVRMPSPYRHPKTGVYWIRRHVPDRLRDRVGVSLYQRTLGTKDLAEAKLRFTEALTELNEHWARLSLEPGRLTRRQCKALAGEYRRWSISRREDDPGPPELLKRQIEHDRFCIKPPGRRIPSVGAVVRELLDDFMAERGIVVHELDMHRLSVDCAHAEVSAKETLLRYALGDYSKTSDGDAYPEYVPLQAAANTSPAAKGRAVGNWMTVADHWDLFVTQKQHELGTQKSWKQKLLAFEAYLGRANLASATPEEIGNWKAELLKSNLSNKTVRDGYIAALRGFLQWGLENGKATVNACANIKVDKQKVIVSDPTKLSRDLSDHDANLILSESLRPSDERTSPLFAKAKRWIPWICAYTGARVNEVTQLRKTDIFREPIRQGEAWIMRITPDAGPVKGGKARDVVLHPHLIEQGLIDFVKEQADGPLFYDFERPRKASKFNQPQRKVGENLAAWVRELGVNNPHVAPNHGWRHRFKTTARRDDVMMDHEVREGMTGHATATVGETYGDMPTGRKWAEVSKLPRYEVQPPTGPLPDTPARRKRNADRVATAERAKARRASTARNAHADLADQPHAAVT